MQLLPFMSLKSAILIVFITLSVNIIAQKKSAQAYRTNEIIKIDGILNEKTYQSASPAKDFFQIQPYNGKAAMQPSEVYILDDENAIYVGAKMYDSHPDSIFNYLTERDNMGMSDYFGIYFDPYNTGQVAYGFFITPAGIQVDIKATNNDGNNEDGNWNEIWESKTKIEKFGWVAEMRIPFTAIRFPKNGAKAWGLNMFRNIRRYNSNNSWNMLDKKVNGFLVQQGELQGIDNISSPLRLSLSPYLSSYYEKTSSSDPGQFLYKGGLDLKYGINEGFTLDMMLIPDFGQIQSDDKRLNLSPYELYYDEKRQFFNEGVELFDRGGIFYSRRIGSAPKFSDNINTNANETVTYNPSETQLVNATKVSGRTNNGWGLGFLNAMSLPAEATIEDTILHSSRKQRLQPFTNYNVLVVDKSLPNNSFFSLINTNVSMTDHPFSANVTATDFQFRDKSQTYLLKGKGAVSVRGEEEKETGYFASLGVEKKKGKLFWGVSQSVNSDKYNPNDLGYLQRNNHITSEAWLYSQTLQPFGIFREINGNIWYNYVRMYSPNVFYDHEAGAELNVRFKNNYYLYSNAIFISNKNDYYEPRVDGRFFYNPYMMIFNFYMSTDQRKNLNLGVNFNTSSQPDFKSTGTSFGADLTWRIGQQFMIELDNQISNDKNEHGYAGLSENNDSIIFSKRDVHTIVNTFVSSYILNNSTSLSLRARHYWSGVENFEYFRLNENGRLEGINANHYNFDQSYNALTIDVLLKWIFAPGSELSVSWKTFSNFGENKLETAYFQNLSDSWLNKHNSLSLKVLYYLDTNKFIKTNKVNNKTEISFVNPFKKSKSVQTDSRSFM